MGECDTPIHTFTHTHSIHSCIHTFTHTQTRTLQHVHAHKHTHTHQPTHSHAGDWLNKRIHDSHGDTTPRPIYFPDEFNFSDEELVHVMQQMNDVTRHVALLLQPLAKA